MLEDEAMIRVTDINFGKPRADSLLNGHYLDLRANYVLANPILTTPTGATSRTMYAESWACRPAATST